MIALAYLAVAVLLGDALASRWFRPVTWFHRLGAAFLVGLLIATWVTYLTSLLFDGRTEDALLVGNLASGWAMALAAIAIYRWVPRRPDAGRPTRGIRAWDVITLVAIGLLVTWMMTSTFSYSNGELGVATGLWSDFGPTTAIAQNFALGDNFPTEYPHYAGEAIRYHFLFYFQVGNLTYLGLDPATANNVLSVGSMLAMLVVVTALGERLFRNAAVGRIGAALFFFHGALSFIPYLAGLGSIDRIVNEVPNLSAFLSSGFPYRGEEWGIWSQIVFLNQRHLSSAIGILLIIVIFLLDRIDRDERTAAAEPAPAAAPSPPWPPPTPSPSRRAGRAAGRAGARPGRLERTRLAIAGQLEAAAFTIRHPVAVAAKPSPTRGLAATCCAASWPACCRCGTAPCSLALPRSLRCGCSSSRAARRCSSSRWWPAPWRSRSSCGSAPGRWPAPRPTRRSTGATSSTTPTSSTSRATWRSPSARRSCWWP